MRPLIIVRPEPGASESAAAAEKIGLSPVLMPLFRIEPLNWTAPDCSLFDSLLLTSANAVRFSSPELERLSGLPAHCVGEATASAAAAAGFAVASVGTRGVDSLLDSIPGELRLLHLCGANRRVPANPVQSIEPIPVYAAIDVTPDRPQRIEGAVVAIHSQRSAIRLSKVASEAGIRFASVAIAAISAEAAAAAGAGWQSVESAATPNDCSLLALAARLCDKPI